MSTAIFGISGLIIGGIIGLVVGEDWGGVIGGATGVAVGYGIVLLRRAHQRRRRAENPTQHRPRPQE